MMSPGLSCEGDRRQMRHRSPGSRDAGSVAGSRRRQQDPLVITCFGGTIHIYKCSNDHKI